MGFPLDDRYQIIHEIDSDRLQLQERNGDRVMMHLARLPQLKAKMQLTH